MYCIPEEEEYHPTRHLCVFSQVPKRILGLTHKGCVLHCTVCISSFGAISDVTVVLWMRQGIELSLCSRDQTTSFTYLKIVHDGEPHQVGCVAEITVSTMCV